MEDPLKLEEKTVRVKRGSQEIIFTLRELTADEYWSIQDSCIDKQSEELFIDTNKMNLQCLAKSIKQPSMTLEGIAKLPSAVSSRLLTEFKILNSVEQTFFLEKSQAKKSKEQK